MTRVQGQEVAQWAIEAAVAYEDEQQRLASANSMIAAELEQLAARELQAWEHLTVTVIPGLVAEHLDWASNLLCLPAIASARVHERMTEERVTLETELAAIEANPDYVERELRLNEHAIQIAELERTLEPLRNAVIPLEQEPIFDELIAVQYDTPNYKTKWYELAYYRHWKHGDLIVERHGEPRGLKTFAAVRERWEQEQGARQTLEAELQQWVAQRTRIEALANRHTQVQELLASLENRHWAITRARVHEHLCDLDGEDLLKLLGDYEPGLYAAKRIAGIAAKRRYLAAIQSEWICKPLEQVQLKLAKVRRASLKYRRPKHSLAWFDGDAMRRKFTTPRDAWDKRWRNVDTAVDRIVTFNRYDDYSLANGIIWWHLMTDGDVKARFIPDVGHYYEHGPTPAYDEDDAHDLAVAALADEAMTSSMTSSNGDSAFDDLS